MKKLSLPPEQEEPKPEVVLEQTADAKAPDDAEELARVRAAWEAGGFLVDEPRTSGFVHFFPIRPTEKLANHSISDLKTLARKLAESVEVKLYGDPLDHVWFGRSPRLFIPIRSASKWQRAERALHHAYAAGFDVPPGTPQYGLNEKDRASRALPENPSPGMLEKLLRKVIQPMQDNIEIIARGQARRRSRSKQGKVSVPTNTDVLIFLAIEAGLKGEAYCKFLHAQGIRPSRELINRGWFRTYPLTYEGPKRRLIYKEKSRFRRWMLKFKAKSPRDFEKAMDALREDKKISELLASLRG